MYALYKNEGAFDKVDIQNSLIEVRQIVHQIDTKIVIICGNASILKTHDVKKACKKHNIRLVYIPPHIKDTNGIELFWSYAKLHYRKAVMKFQTILKK